MMGVTVDAEAKMFERMKEWLGRGRARVLVAEDDPAMRELIVAVLRVDGYEVLEASDGRRLLAYIQSSVVDGKQTPPPDLIISDIRMPGYTGLEILKALREAELEVPVVLISAFADDDVHRQAFELGAVMMDKPLELSTLRNTVKLLVR